MPLFPEAWMDELLSKSDIVSIVSEYVTLKPKGRRMWGCCPFHSEKTPSFSVNPDNQFYYCFGCHAGGGAVQFVMEMEKLTFVEAVKYLAQRAGMELPDEVDDAKLLKERAVKERLYAACREAARFYHDRLMEESGEKARNYLVARGLDGSTVKRFGLGYAPEGWENLVSYMEEKGYAKDELINAGLAVAGKKQGGCYDAYRGRIIFPIIATTGRVIGFGARAMGDEQPKYLNTGDTPIYNKRNNLYALNLQKGKRPVDLVMVEGYMDVISLHKGGVDNAVASLGTALTQQQARLIKRYVSKVYICYDGDAAGQSATLRGLNILAKEGLEVRVIRLPGGMDPDDYIKKKGRDAFLSLKDGAISLNAFKLAYLESGFDLSTEDGREGYAKRACAFVSTLQPVERERFIEPIARKSGLPSETVKAQCGAVRAVAGNSITKNRNTRSKKSEEITGLHEKTEQLLLSCMLRDKQAAIAAMTGMAEEGISFEGAAAETLANELMAAYLAEDELDERRFMAKLSPELADCAAAAQSLAESVVEPLACAKDCLKTLQKQQIHERIIQLAMEAEGLEAEQRRKITSEMEALQDKLKRL